MNEGRGMVVEAAGTPRSYVSGLQKVTFVPLVIRKRQNRKVITPPDPAVVPQCTPDVRMIKLIGKAFYWQRLIDDGAYASGNELARAMRLEPGYVAEVLRLTLLAPDIVEAILDGRQPRHLHPHLIKGRIAHLPREWDRQREVLGFPVAERSG
jgi:hypothetical protein